MTAQNQIQQSNTFMPNTVQNTTTNTQITSASAGKPRKKTSTQTILLIITTVVIGTAVPATVLLVGKDQDIRGKAQELKTTPPYPTFKPSPSPKLSECSQACTKHADCIAGFFCTDTEICKNALCPENIDCVCEEKE